MQFSRRLCRMLYYMLLATYVASLIVFEETRKSGSSLLGRLGYPLVHFAYPAWRRLTHREEYVPALLLHTILLMLLMAGVIFVGLWLLRRVSAIEIIGLHAAGLIIAAGFPCGWIFFGSPGGLRAVSDRWLPAETVEVALAIACVLMYVHQRWIKRLIGLTIVICAHFGIWGMITWAGLATPVWGMYLILGVCVGVIWGVYVRQVGGFYKRGGQEKTLLPSAGRG